jgi:tetrahydromethanopterin S-methyltransferase subunit B
LLPFFSAIANQESLSGLETEMRKLEGIVKEIVDEMDYLKRREEKFQNTNGVYTVSTACPNYYYID